MRRLAAVVLMAVSAATAFPQETPQIAVRYLEEYVKTKEISGDDRTSGWATVISGGVVATGGVLLYFTGDALTRSLSGEAWDDTTKYAVTGTMVGTGLVVSAVGGGMLAGRNADHRSRYEHIFTQPLPHLRERQASDALFELADRAYRRRRVAGLVKIGIPLLTVATTLTANAILPDREWHEDVSTIAFGQIWSVVSGFSDLARRSPEERLYDRYRAELAGAR